MPEIIIIAAVARNRVIGKDNQLLWNIPEDMAHFKALTAGHPVIMGRKTWESLPARFRPLPDRDNIVVTRNPGYLAPGAAVAHSLEDALRKVGAGKTAFVIGGAELYRHALPLARRLELTEIDADIDGDTRFPAFDRAAWRETRRETGAGANGLAYAFVAYARV